MTDPVRIYEVGPRDGLQNEATPLPTDAKRRFIELLVEAGLTEIEATSFVAPSAIPALADADDLLASLPARPASAIPFSSRTSAALPELKPPARTRSPSSPPRRMPSRPATSG